MMARIMMGLFHWKESLQVSSAHRLVTSLEQFRAIVQIIEENADLANQVQRIRWQHGAEEIQTKDGCRFIIKAGGSAARGLSKPESVHLDEIRELHDMETFAAMRYTLMAAKNPQVNCFSTAGDSHSIVLNQLRERGLAAAAGGADDVGYFEWSAPTDEISIDNAAFGRTLSSTYLNANGNYYVNYSYLLPTDLDPDNTHLLIYVYDKVTHEVYQVIKQDIN
jgi:hypothetical protein